MPRIRTIKPEFFTSPDTAQLDFPVRIFYEALWCWADDFGIGETNLNGLLGFAFPDTDNFTAQDVRRFCADVARIMRVTFYTVRGRHYYAIPTWDEHQKTERRTDRRKYPTPDDPDAVPDQRIYACADSAPDMPRKNGAECALEQGNRGTGEVGTGEQGNPLTGGVGGTLSVVPAPEAPAKPTPRKKGTRIPSADWMPQQKTVDAIKRDFPNATSEQIRHQHNLFIDWATGSASRNAIKVDWDATWRGWMRRELPKHGTTRNGIAPSDARVARVQALKDAGPPIGTYPNKELLA